MLNLKMRIEANRPVFLNCRPTIHRTKFLVISAFSCTVYKVQGLALSSNDVPFESNRQKKSNLCNAGQVTKQLFSTLSVAEKEYNWVRSQCSLTTSYIYGRVSVALLNEGFNNIGKNPFIRDTSIVLIEETQVPQNFDG